MPLPDERPRGSVANLIGRFENQVKRQPSSSPASARSLSATSHVSEDSAKEEAKERYEWPPKSTSPDIKPPFSIPSSSFAQSLALAQAVSADAQAVVAEDASLTPRSRSTTSSPDNLKPAVTTPQQQLSIDVIASAPATLGTPTTAKPPTNAKPPPAKSAAQATGKSSTMTSGRTSKSTGIRPSTAPATHLTKSQNTGPRNPSAFTRKAVAKPTPSSSTSPGITPTSTRPKTPSTLSRTLSSGLFAPTAASLAKSRNAQQPSVPSSKKAALSSAATERLSKPTAASLSRTRIPTTGAKPTTRGTLAIKPKATGSTTKKAGITPTGKKFAAATTGAAAPIAAATDPESVVSEGMIIPSEESEHQVDDNHIDKDPEDAIDSEELLESSSSAVEKALATDEHLNGEAAEANNEADVASAGDDLVSHDVPLEHAEQARMAHVNGGHEPEIMSKAHIGNQIEDMVSLLESMSASKVRPESPASIPDEE